MSRRVLPSLLQPSVNEISSNAISPWYWLPRTPSIITFDKRQWQWMLPKRLRWNWLWREVTLLTICTMGCTWKFSLKVSVTFRISPGNSVWISHFDLVGIAPLQNKTGIWKLEKAAISKVFFISICQEDSYNFQFFPVFWKKWELE